MFEFLMTLAKELMQKLLHDPVWSVVGLTGQFTFAGRFILQWIVSEFKKMSHVPVAFWYLSLVGSFIMLVYTIHIKDIILIAGFTLNSAIYIRNLHLIYKHRKTGEITEIERDED